MDLLIYNHFMHTLIFLTNSLLLFLIFSILALDFYLHFILHEAGSLSLVIKALDNVYIILQCPSRWKFELRILVSWWQLRIVREVSSCQNFLCIKSPITYTNQLASATCHCSQWGKRRTQATRPGPKKLMLIGKTRHHVLLSRRKSGWQPAQVPATVPGPPKHHWPTFTWCAILLSLLD